MGGHWLADSVGGASNWVPLSSVLCEYWAPGRLALYYSSFLNESLAGVTNERQFFVVLFVFNNVLYVCIVGVVFSCGLASALLTASSTYYAF